MAHRELSLDNLAAARRADSLRDAPGSLGPEMAIPPLGALPRPLALIGAAEKGGAGLRLTVRGRARLRRTILLTPSA